MRTAAETLATLAAAAGDRAVRAGLDDDAIDGIRPTAVVEPASPDAVARVLEAAAAASLSVVVRGGGTKLTWGRVPGEIDAILSTRRLSALAAHAHADLTVEVEAGMPVSALNGELAKAGQWLPIESPFERATVGGTLATDDAGPARHRYGTPRDLVIGVRLATPDGQLVRAGGNVVKNVAGYDLGRLVSGSFGSLAVIVAATFKLTPLAPATGSLVVAAEERAAAAAAAQALAASQLDPMAIDIADAGGRLHLLVRFASTAAVVNGALAKAAVLVGPFASRMTEFKGDEDDAMWRAHVARPWRDGVVVRLTWRPAALEAVLAAVAALRSEGGELELVARAGIGAGLLRVGGSPADQAAVVRALRERQELFDQVTMLAAGAEVKSMVDVWGNGGETAPLMAAIKRAFDPNRILNAGRGPL